jgi:hypothetical protein
MVVPDASPPAYDKAERVQLTGTFAEFRTALGEEIDAAQRTMRPATGDGARDAR